MKIDPHVHFRDQEQSYKETIAHGMKIAKEQGVDIVFDMPNTAKPILTKEDVQKRLELAPKKGYCLYIGATSNEDQLKQAIEVVKNIKQVIGIKMFAGKSVGNLEIIDENKQANVYAILAKNNYKGVLAVHCEKEKYMKDKFNPEKPITHAKSRPNKAEIKSIKDQIKFAKQANFQGILHICHISCKKSVELVEQAREGIKITCGVTPHHLMWTNRKLREKNGLLYKMNPPLRSRRDVKALKKYLKQGKINWIETDHAPHALGEKLHSGYPSGYPSLYLYKKCVEEFLPKIGINNEQIEDLTYNNIKRVFKLR